MMETCISTLHFMRCVTSETSIPDGVTDVFHTLRKVVHIRSGLLFQVLEAVGQRA